MRKELVPQRLNFKLFLHNQQQVVLNMYERTTFALPSVSMLGNLETVSSTCVSVHSDEEVARGLGAIGSESVDCTAISCGKGLTGCGMHEVHQHSGVFVILHYSSYRQLLSFPSPSHL